MRAHQRDDHYPLWSKLMYRLPACIVWLYYMHPAQQCGGFRTIIFFFLLSVLVALKKKKKLNGPGRSRSK